MYWVVHLKSGETLDFGKKLGYAELKEEKFVALRKDKYDKISRCLIPYENILYMMYVDEEGQFNG